MVLFQEPSVKAIIQTELDQADKDAIELLSAFSARGMSSGDVQELLGRVFFWLNAGISKEQLKDVEKQMVVNPGNPGSTDIPHALGRYIFSTGAATAV